MYRVVPVRAFQYGVAGGPSLSVVVLLGDLFFRGRGAPLPSFWILVCRFWSASTSFRCFYSRRVLG